MAKIKNRFFFTMYQNGKVPNVIFSIILTCFFTGAKNSSCLIRLGQDLGTDGILLYNIEYCLYHMALWINLLVPAMPGCYNRAGNSKNIFAPVRGKINCYQSPAFQTSLYQPLLWGQDRDSAIFSWEKLSSGGYW
jgi:hypothetical protein